LSKNKITRTELNKLERDKENLERKLMEANQKLEKIESSFENWRHQREAVIQIMTTGPTRIFTRGHTLMQGESIEIHGYKGWKKFQEKVRGHYSTGEVRLYSYGPTVTGTDPVPTDFLEPGVIEVRLIHKKPEDANSERCPKCDSLRWHERFSYSSGGKMIKECYSCQHRWDVNTEEEE